MTTKKMAIIATKGTLDMAYPPFILASTAAALGYDVQIFFTFYGLQLLRKDLSNVMIQPPENSLACTVETLSSAAAKAIVIVLFFIIFPYFC